MYFEFWVRHWNLFSIPRILEWVPGIEPGSPALQADSGFLYVTAAMTSGHDEDFKFENSSPIDMF